MILTARDHNMFLKAKGMTSLYLLAVVSGATATLEERTTMVQFDLHNRKFFQF